MSVIHVVGLGPGDMSSCPLGTMKELQSGKPVFFRTLIHPVVQQLTTEVFSQSHQVQSFDYLYESGDTFEAIYREMADILLATAETVEDIVYAVPGHPLMAEQSVQNLLKQADGTHVKVKIGAGQSFVDAVCTLLQVDPIEGLSILDGTLFNSQQLRPALHTLVVQVFDAAVASEVKLTLMEVFPDDYLVTVIRAAGVPGQERSEVVPLHELDRLGWIDHLTTVYVPKTTDDLVQRKDPWQVVNLVRRLREPGGCPWDQRQTHQSLRPYVIEEAYEVAEAILSDDDFALCEELGDLLLQVLLHAQIGAEAGTFDIRDVFAALADKLIRRHPHVFGEVQAKSAEEAEKMWQAAKANEYSLSPNRAKSETAGESRPNTGPTEKQTSPSVLAQVKWAQPAVLTSLALQAAAARVGFDWPSVEGVFAKVREETEEVASSFREQDQAHLTEEVGDLLFTVINLARWFQVHPDEALSLANHKFYRRFVSMEKFLRENGQDFEKMSLEELDIHWNRSKSTEKTLGKQGK